MGYKFKTNKNMNTSSYTRGNNFKNITFFVSGMKFFPYLLSSIYICRCFDEHFKKFYDNCCEFLDIYEFPVIKRQIILDDWWSC